jgi:hypothetical protein
LVKDHQNGVSDIHWVIAVLDFIVLIQLDVHFEQWELVLGSTHCFDLFRGVVDISDVVGRLDGGLEGQEPGDRVNEALDTALGHLKDSVSHHELVLRQELL